MKRTTWFLAGTAAGAYLMSRARRASQGLTYDGLTDRLAGLFAGARVFGEEVGLAAAEKENQLRERLGLGHNDARPVDGPDPEPEQRGELDPGPDERGND